MTEPSEPRTSQTFAELAALMKAVQPIRRILICEIGKKLQVEALVLRYDMAAFWEVRESVLCPEGKVVLVEEPPPLVKTK